MVIAQASFVLQLFDLQLPSTFCEDISASAVTNTIEHALQKRLPKFLNPSAFS